MQARSFVRKGLATISLPVALIVLSTAGFAADKKHQDAFTSGDPNETRIAKQVRHELLMLPYYTVFDDLAFRVDGSTVTLLGAVVRPTLKSDAEHVVQKVEGVTRVVNEIEVLPVSSIDDQLRRVVFRTIFGDPVLSRYGWGAVPSIHIIVKNGNVILEGVVDNETDKNLAYLRVNGVPNVFSVTNDLQVGGK
jgi:hyperosmotically inducible protein